MKNEKKWSGVFVTLPGVDKAAHMWGSVDDPGGSVPMTHLKASAKVADEHHFVRPGSDAFVLLAMLHVLTAEAERPPTVAAYVDGLETVIDLVADFTPERAEAVSGLAAEEIVVRHYGLPVAAARWRGPGGEIDLILRDGATVIFVTHDLDEAIYLGDRVIGLLPHPGRIGIELAVNLPRPRDQLSTREHPEFLRLRRQLFDFIKATEQ